MTSGVKWERDCRTLLEENGFVVVRGAGSLGVDLVAIKASKTLLIECKWVTGDRYYGGASMRNRNQIRRIIEDSIKSGAIPIMAIKYSPPDGQPEIEFFDLRNPPDRLIFRIGHGRDISLLLSLMRCD